jgi:stage II sporulation protein D
VAETRGLIALHAGRPIDALYTSTCGGHTEDVENVFSARDPAPWLRGVACTAERETWIELQGAPPTEAGGDRPLLVALGAWPAAVPAGGSAIGGGVLAEILARLPAAIGRRGCGAAPASIDTRGQLFAGLVSALCWGDRAALLAPGEAEYLLPRGEAWASEGERRAAAVLLGAGVLRGGPLQPAARPTAAETARLLAEAVRAAQPARLGEERVLGLGAGRIEVRRGDGIASLPLDPGVQLVRRDALGSARVGVLTLVPGESVRLVSAGDRVVYLEVDVAAEGPAWDRGSRYHAWRVTLTPHEVAERAAGAGWSGRLLDIVPERRGVSGRVVEARLVGEGHELPLRGLAVRRALGLRESLLAIERDLGPDGRVERFHFTGRGWGHGVGLCQVGAFGMAGAGHRFEAILRHYYTGIELGRIPATQSE